MTRICYEKDGAASGGANQKLTLFGSERRITQSQLDALTGKCSDELKAIILPLGKVTDFQVTFEARNSFDIVEWIFSIELHERSTPFAYLSARHSGTAVNIEKLRVANALQRHGVGTTILKYFRQLVELTGTDTLTTDIADPGNPEGVKKAKIDKLLGIGAQGSSAAAAGRMTAFFAKQGFQKYPIFVQKSGMILSLKK